MQDMHHRNQKDVRHRNTARWPRKIISLGNHLGKPVELQQDKAHSQYQGKQQPPGAHLGIIGLYGRFRHHIGDAAQYQYQSTI